MKSKPIISVIVPIHNVGEYLSQCIESIINQSFNASDRVEYYNFNDEMKKNFIKYLTPINISDWSSSPLRNDGSLRK